MRNHQGKEKAVVDTHRTISMRTSKVSCRLGAGFSAGIDRLLEQGALLPENGKKN